ncbi:peptide chain release factor N(5)-glutamine methyltransferase [Ramlibacter tataouinensis]|uniref:Release factor glutamine methyltransferase n=1 Tax=Ramlibacter tataouinensis (strain ATCC BAA-407 / DSM 14655 / LMG 21543 / TTB310) TaxID=365046 RepID=F5Y6D1_RAMTT|nr:peptide chain release factor N(5)-glutamine methyltransferase [Ramlibacter tataouinensis]AEG94005.1 Protein-(glutamine-N5) MTase hemK [Ramlibacter tataouinensis TTB310]
MTLAQALASAQTLGLARLDAQLLLLHALGRRQQERAWLLAHDTDELPAAAAAAFEALCSRRHQGEPLAYLVGHKEFFGLQLAVDPRVLVPRPDTETLVEWAVALLAGRERPAVADLGTGSGAIALALKRRVPGARVLAVDRSAPALAVAAGNAAAHGLEVAWRQGSWLEGLDGPFDLIVSNPPYVAASDPHLAALRHEPLSALASGPDGLDDIRTIVAQAPARLAPGGWLLLEHGWDQAEAVRALLRSAGLAAVRSRRDLAGIERCSGGQRVELG